MREILFRGISEVTDEWVYGYLVKTRIRGNEYFSIVPYDDLAKTLAEKRWFQVIPETVGQYTGLTDKNGKKIFEGDVVDVAYKVDYVGTSKHRLGLFKVVFHNGCFMKKAIPNPQLSFNDNAERSGLYHFIPSDETEVVGNIFDNAEYGGGAEL